MNQLTNPRWLLMVIPFFFLYVPVQILFVLLTGDSNHWLSYQFTRVNMWVWRY